MTIVNLFLLVVVAVFLLAALLVLILYNGFVRSRLFCEEAWSGIEVQLKRRADLVPNLVETVKGYASHERHVLENVTRARAALQDAKGAAEKGTANNLLTQALGGLFAVVENYPELKASENFMALHGELVDVEEKIAYARQFYNRNVLDYNMRIRVMPQALIARLCNFKPMDFFEEHEAPEGLKVEF
jgi:LemA protein